jgi:hypothetical protein
LSHNTSFAFAALNLNTSFFYESVVVFYGVHWMMGFYRLPDASLVDAGMARSLSMAKIPMAGPMERKEKAHRQLICSLTTNGMEGIQIK